MAFAVAAAVGELLAAEVVPAVEPDEEFCDAHPASGTSKAAALISRNDLLVRFMWLPVRIGFRNARRWA
jgi:hypothetical protein